MTKPMHQHDLATVAADLRDGTLDADDATWLSDALAKIADGEPANAALGLRRQRADMLAAINARNRILRDAAATMLPELPMIEAASRIHNAMLRYWQTAWRRERLLDECPLPHGGTLREVAWEVLRLWDAVPSVRSIRRILAKGEACSRQRADLLSACAQVRK